MAKIVEGALAVDFKLSNIHAGGQCGAFLDSTGFWIAPAGHQARTISGGVTACPGAPSITLNRQQSIAGFGNVLFAGVLETLATYTLPANVLTRAGQAILIRIVGSVAAASTKKLQINVGAVVFQVVNNSANAVSALFDFTVRIVRTGSKLQYGILEGAANGTTVTGFAKAKEDGAGNVAVLSMALDDTVANVIAVQGADDTRANGVLINEFTVTMEQN